MRIGIKNNFKDKIIKIFIIIICFLIASYIFDIILNHGRFVGTIIRNLVGNQTKCLTN